MTKNAEKLSDSSSDNICLKARIVPKVIVVACFKYSTEPEYLSIYLFWSLFASEIGHQIIGAHFHASNLLFSLLVCNFIIYVVISSELHIILGNLFCALYIPRCIFSVLLGFEMISLISLSHPGLSI